MISSTTKRNRYNKILDQIDYPTNGYKFREESMMHKTFTAILLIKNSLNAVIKTDYVLMDTWLITEPMIKAITQTGLDVIGKVKQLKQHYTCNSK